MSENNFENNLEVFQHLFQNVYCSYTGPIWNKSGKRPSRWILSSAVLDSWFLICLLEKCTKAAILVRRKVGVVPGTWHLLHSRRVFSSHPLQRKEPRPRLQANHLCTMVQGRFCDWIEISRFFIIFKRGNVHFMRISHG